MRSWPRWTRSMGESGGGHDRAEHSQSNLFALLLQVVNGADSHVLPVRSYSTRSLVLGERPGDVDTVAHARRGHVMMTEQGQIEAIRERWREPGIPFTLGDMHIVLAALDAARAALRPFCTRGAGISRGTDGDFCVFCGPISEPAYDHRSDCSITKARALLGDHAPIKEQAPSLETGVCDCDAGSHSSLVSRDGASWEHARESVEEASHAPFRWRRL